MLTICIPTYNYNVSPLLRSLAEQLEKIEQDVDVVVIDDGSEDEFRRTNEATCRALGMAFIALSTNLGRSKVRNAFLPFIKGEYLLFLDDDGVPHSPDFLKNYVAVLDTADVLCGGRIYPETAGSRQLLHWKYGTFRESQPAPVRSQRPYHAFMTNNFVVRTEVFSQIQFDESITEYGHEDTLFGLELRKGGFLIKHIHNPVVHMQIENSESFLAKTDLGIRNLAQLVNKGKITNGVRLVDANRRYTKWIPNAVISALEALFLPILKRNLTSSRPSLKAFSCYKWLRLNTYLKASKN